MQKLFSARGSLDSNVCVMVVGTINNFSTTLPEISKAYEK